MVGWPIWMGAWAKFILYCVNMIKQDFIQIYNFMYIGMCVY